MIQQFFYGKDGHEHGPCTAMDLRDLARAGKILTSDIIWKEGALHGTPASSITNLFPALTGLPAAVAVFPAAVSAAPPLVHAARAPEPPVLVEQPTAVVAAAAAPVTVEKKPARKLRAMAMLGAKITGQDGVTVQFKKICTQCHHEDAARATMKIRIGVTRLPYYCPKCRKAREVSIQGMG